jgi:hypothetical protein
MLISPWVDDKMDPPIEVLIVGFFVSARMPLAGPKICGRQGGVGYEGRVVEG